MIVIMLNIRISAGLRPASAASARIAATGGAMILADGPDLNTPSAWGGGDGPPLRRRLSQVDGVQPIIVSLVLDAMHLGRIGEDASHAIAHRRIVLPASFP